MSLIFTSGKVEMMFPIMNNCGDHLKDYIDVNLKTNTNAKELAAKYTTDVIASTCAFVIETNCLLAKTMNLGQ